MSLQRQRSELCALTWLDAKDASSDATAGDLSVEPTPAKRLLNVRLPAHGEGESPNPCLSQMLREDALELAPDERNGARGVASAFSIALDHELEQRRASETPATTSSAMPLHSAVASADVDAVRALLWPKRDDEDASAKDDDATWPPRKSPLRRLSSATSLKSISSDGERAVEARNEHGDTALAVASALERSSAELVEMLLSAGADVSAISSSGYAPAHWAARTGNVTTLDVLAKRSSRKRVVDIRASDGSTPLLVAAAYGKMEVVEWLAKRDERGGGCNAFAVDALGRNVLGVLGSKMGRLNLTERAKLRAKVFNLIPELRVAFLSHPDCEEHVSFKPHQESPERMTAIFEELQRVTERGELMLDELERSESFNCAEPHDILLAHSEEYVCVLAKLSNQVGHTPIAFTPFCQNQKGVPEKLRKSVENSDTFFSPGTLQAALRAAGGVLQAVDRVLEKRNRSAFVCCRPPGHHAGVSGATEGAPSSGFSILNNAMIGTYVVVASARLSTFVRIRTPHAWPIHRVM